MATKAPSRKRGPSISANRARLLATEREDADHRSTDPYEQCKVFLGRRGYVVFNRRLVYGAMFKGYQLGKLVVETEREVIAYARKLGWIG